MSAATQQQQPTDPDQARMTLGEHLDDLRGCLLRSLVAVFVACLVCIWPARYVLAVLVRPVVLALRAHGQPDSLLATGPAENLLVYVKVVLIAGLVLAAPYVLYQVWSFVAAGLYSREKAVVLRMFPISVGLFAVGVAFMYTFALLLSLNFLVGFSAWLPRPEAVPLGFERHILGLPELPTTQPDLSQWPTVPALDRDPAAPPAGAVWFNERDQRLKLHTGRDTYSYQLQRDDRPAMVTTHFRIGEYLSFVLLLTIAFGVAFQMPLVVVVLVWSGLVRVETLRKYRKAVILLVVLIAGILAPPDLFSHLLLGGPMVLLFEIGLLIASRGKSRPAADRPPAAAG